MPKYITETQEQTEVYLSTLLGLFFLLPLARPLLLQTFIQRAALHSADFQKLPLTYLPIFPGRVECREIREVSFSFSPQRFPLAFATAMPSACL